MTALFIIASLALLLAIYAAIMATYLFRSTKQKQLVGVFTCTHAMTLDESAKVHEQIQNAIGAGTPLLILDRSSNFEVLEV